MIEKLEKDGKIAIIISHGYGAGWSTWAEKHSEEMLFDPVLAQAILDGKNWKELKKIAKERYPDEYAGGMVGSPKVHWLDKGTKFYVNEYDGAESLLVFEDLRYTA